MSRSNSLRDVVFPYFPIALFLFSFVHLLFLSCGKAEPPPDITDPGQLLFLGYAKEDINCSRCHGPEGQGGQDAPDIRSAFDKYDEDAILDIIEYGKGEGKEAMPPFEGKLTDADLADLVRFLETLNSNKSHK